MRNIKIVFMIALLATFSLSSCDATLQGFISQITSWDFGDVDVSVNVQKTITIENMSESDYTLQEYAFEGVNASDFTLRSGFSVGAKIPGGGTRNFVINFLPSDGGAKVGTFKLKSNAPNSPTVVELVGNGINNPAFYLPTTSHNYGTYFVGYSKSQSFTIQNSGTGDLIISTFTLSGTNSGEFRTNATPQTIAANQTYNFEIFYEPTQLGVASAQLDIVYNTVGSPSAITLEGTAAAPATLINVTPTLHDFGILRIGNSSDNEFRITNTGVLNLILTQIDVIAGTSTEFSIIEAKTSGNTPINTPYGCIISANDYITVKVQFAPTVLGANKTSTLRISHNALGGTTDVSLTGFCGHGILINELGIDSATHGNFEYVEIYNYTNSPIDITGWKLTTYMTGALEGDYTFGTVSIPAKTCIVVYEQNTGVPYYFGSNISWWYCADQMEIKLLDDTNQPIDYMCTNYATSGPNKGTCIWNGNLPGTTSFFNFYRNGIIDSNSPTGWASRRQSVDEGAKNPGQP